MNSDDDLEKKIEEGGLRSHQHPGCVEVETITMTNIKVRVRGLMSDPQLRGMGGQGPKVIKII